MPNRCSAEPETLAIDEPMGRRWGLSMVTRHRAAALTMHLDVCIEIDISSPSGERLEARGWPAQYQPPWSTRSSAHQEQRAKAHSYHTKTRELSGSDPTFDPASDQHLLSHRRPSTSSDHRGRGVRPRSGRGRTDELATRVPAHRTGPPVGRSSRDAAAARGRTFETVALDRAPGAAGGEVQFVSTGIRGVFSL